MPKVLGCGFRTGCFQSLGVVGLTRFVRERRVQGLEGCKVSRVLWEFIFIFRVLRGFTGFLEVAIKSFCRVYKVP